MHTDYIKRSIQPFTAAGSSIQIRFRRTVASLSVLVAISVPIGASRADIVGFNGLNPAQWRYNQSDTGTPADLPNADTVHLTSGSPQGRSIFFRTPQDVTQFEASFTFQALNNCCNPSQSGFTFALQDDPRGPNALGSSLGYTGIARSAAVTFNLGNTSGFFSGGVIGSGAQLLSPVNLLSGRPIAVTLAYDGFYLSETLVDTVTLASYSRPNIIVGDMANLVGGSTAYVGFTAGTFQDSVDQYISDFRFSSIPEPGSMALLVLGSAALLGRQSRKMRYR